MPENGLLVPSIHPLNFQSITLERLRRREGNLPFRPIQNPRETLMQHSAHHLPRLLAMALVLLSACQGVTPTPRSDINGSGDTFFGDVRISIPFEEKDPDALRVGLRVEMEKAGGDFDQSVGAGHVVELDNVPFTGPGVLSVDFEHTFVGAGLYVSKDRGRVHLEGVVGLGKSILEADALFGGMPDATQVDSFGPFLGGSISYPVFESLALYGELFFFGGISSNHNISLRSFEVGTAWRVTQNLKLSLGWKDWGFSAARDQDHLFGSAEPSDLELGIDGPLLRLEFTL